MRYRDKNQKNYIGRLINTQNNNKVMWKEAQRELCERKSSIKIVLESKKSENFCIRKTGKELGSC